MSNEHERWAARLKRDAERPVEKEITAFGGLETVVEGGSLTSDSGVTDEAATSSSPKSKRESRDLIPPPHPSLAFANTSSSVPPRLQKSTSSLATNLASARGIPQSQLTARLASGATSPGRRRTGNLHTNERGQPLPGTHDFPSSKPTTNPLTLLPPDDPPSRAPGASSKPHSAEEPFSKFYSSLNTLVSRIGSPFAASLAFAGLPLDPDPDSDTEAAARRALLPRGWTEGRGRGRGLDKGWSTGEGGESFYVVPVSGGTLSYAGVVRRDSSPAASPPDDFGGFDMLKSPARSARDSANFPALGERDRDRDRANPNPLTGYTKTKEELQLENTGLRQAIDHMSRTMHTWQRKTKESENMLKNSIFALSKGDGGRAGLDILNQVARKSWLHVPYDEGEGERGAGGGGEEEDEVISEGRRVGEMEWEKEQRDRRAEEEAEEKDDRIRALEEELDAMRREAERMGRENEKLKKVLEKAKDKWERLKEGARTRKAGGAGLGSVEEGE